MPTSGSSFTEQGPTESGSNASLKRHKRATGSTALLTLITHPLRFRPWWIWWYDSGGWRQQHILRSGVNIFKRILKKAGLREIRIHDMRHTFASFLLTQGESPVYVKEQLGHHSIQMTVDIYGHLIPSSNRQAVNQLDDENSNAPYIHPEKRESPES